MINDNNNSQKWAKFFGKLIIGIVAGAILTPIPAILAGSTTYLVADTIKENTEDDEVKELFSFISDCSKDVVFGGALGGVIGNESFTVLSKGTKLIGNSAGKEISKNGMTSSAKVLINACKLISFGQKNEKFIGLGFKAWEIKKHNKHLEKRIKYLKGCEICDS